MNDEDRTRSVVRDVADEINEQRVQDMQENIAAELWRQEHDPAPKPKGRTPVGAVIASIFNYIFTAAQIVASAFTISMIAAMARIVFNPDAGAEGLALIALIPVCIIGIGAALVLAIPAIVFFAVGRFSKNKYFKISTLITFVLNLLLPVLLIIAFFAVLLLSKSVGS